MGARGGQEWQLLLHPISSTCEISKRGLDSQVSSTSGPWKKQNRRCSSMQSLIFIISYMLYKVFNDYGFSKEINTAFCYNENLQTSSCFVIESFGFHGNKKTFYDFSMLIITDLILFLTKSSFILLKLQYKYRCKHIQWWILIYGNTQSILADQYLSLLCEFNTHDLHACGLQTELLK